MDKHDVSQLVWELVTTKSSTFYKASMGPLVFSKKRRYAIKLESGREFSAEEVQFDLTVDFVAGTGVLLYHAAISRLINPYRPGLTLIVRSGEGLTFRKVLEETIFIVSYQFP